MSEENIKEKEEKRKEPEKNYLILEENFKNKVIIENYSEINTF
jgi:hypothetical protein